MSIRKFLLYNNTVPIVLGILFLSSGIVFAANEEVREFVSDSVYQAQQRVVSIDNSYIANVDLDAFSPKVAIQGVAEDDEFYYIDYTFTTITLVDAVWQDVAENREMRVAKTALGEYQDLGVYVTEQLKQVVDRELVYLKEVQSIEKQNVTSKIVATAYSGLVGQFIDESTEALPGYTPQIQAPNAENDPDPVAVAKAQRDDVVTPPAPNGNTGGTNDGAHTESNVETNTSGPVISILGANPSRIPLNASYSDLGVVVTSATGVTLSLPVVLSVNGQEVQQVSIDTTGVADWSVGYQVTDEEGNTTFEERVVIVYDPNAPQQEEAQETATTTTATSDDTASTTATTTSTTTATTTATTTQETSLESEPAGPTPEEEEGTEETATSTQQTTSNESATSTTPASSEETGATTTATTTDAS